MLSRVNHQKSTTTPSSAGDLPRSIRSHELKRLKVPNYTRVVAHVSCFPLLMIIANDVESPPAPWRKPAHQRSLKLLALWHASLLKATNMPSLATKKKATMTSRMRTCLQASLDGLVVIPNWLDIPQQKAAGIDPPAGLQHHFKDWAMGDRWLQCHPKEGISCSAGSLVPNCCVVRTVNPTCYMVATKLRRTISICVHGDAKANVELVLHWLRPGWNSLYVKLRSEQFTCHLSIYLNSTWNCRRISKGKGQVVTSSSVGHGRNSQGLRELQVGAFHTSRTKKWVRGEMGGSPSMKAILTLW